MRNNNNANDGAKMASIVFHENHLAALYYQLHESEKNKD